MNKNVKKKIGGISEDTIVNRMMLVFIEAIAAVVICLIIARSGKTENHFVAKVLPILRYIFIGATAVSIIWRIICKKRGIDESRRIITSTMLLNTSAVLLISSVIYTSVNNSGVIAFIVAATVLAFVKVFYQYDFTLVTLLMFVGIIGLLAVRKTLTGYLPNDIVIWTFRAVCAFIVPVYALIQALTASKNNGKAALFGRSFPEGTIYWPFFAASALILAGAVAGIFFAPIAVYAAGAALVLFLVCAIVYTVKLV